MFVRCPRQNRVQNNSQGRPANTREATTLVSLRPAKNHFFAPAGAFLVFVCSVGFAQPTDHGFAYPAPAEGTYLFSRDVAYRTHAGVPVLADIYRPANKNGAHSPVLIFMNTRGPSSLRNHPIYLGWGRLAASEGFVAVVPDASADGAEKDFNGVLDYVGAHATELAADPEQIGIYAASGNGNGLLLVEDPKRSTVRAAAIYYGFVPPLEKYRSDLPVLLVRAGLDRPMLNRNIAETVQAAVAQNAPFTLLNYPAGHHGFEQLDQNEASREVIRQTLTFFKIALSRPYQTALWEGIPVAEAAGALAQGDFQQAADLYGRLVTSRPTDSLLRLSYGEALLGAGNYKSAREQFDALKGAGLGPRDLALPAARAAALDGDAESAIAWLRTIPSRFLSADMMDDPAFEKLRERADFRELFSRVP
jgi:dienelactone hydrolase